MNLNITKEKVLEAASKCSTAKQTLQVLFPEAFEIPRITSVNKGDIFKHPEGVTNTFMVVETRYCMDGNEYYQLLGMGCGINSSAFFENHSSHTKQEIIDYLNQREMVFSHNIQNVIHNLHDKGICERLALGKI